MSFKKLLKDTAGKPLHPTSTAQIFTFHHLVLAFRVIFSYFCLFSSPETSILSSLGTVSSIIPNCFVFDEISYVWPQVGDHNIFRNL